MKLELSYDEISTIVAALLTKVTTAESNALKCAKYAWIKMLSFGKKELKSTKRSIRW